MDWSPVKLYDSIKLVLLFYCFASDHMPQAIMDTIVPGLLRAKECEIAEKEGKIMVLNETGLSKRSVDANNTPIVTFSYNNISSESVCDKRTKQDDSIQIAVIAALFHVPMLLFGIPGGWLVSKLNPNWVYATARFITGFASFSFGFFTTTDFILYSFPVVYGTGWVLSEVSLYHILAVNFPKDSVRLRAMSFGYAITAVGYVLAYICGTYFYASYGVALYLVLGVIDFNVGALYALISYKNRAMEEDHHLLDKREETGSVIDSKLALLCYFQNFAVYYAFRVIAVTAPLWLQTQLKMTVTQNGLTFGVPAAVHVVSLILIVIFVGGNTSRWMVLTGFILLQAIGFICYPFVSRMSEAMAADTASRACKLVIMALSPSLLFHIADQEKLGPYAQISGSFAAVRHLGSILGSIFSGLLVTVFGFEIVCIATGIVLIPLAMSTVAFSKLP